MEQDGADLTTMNNEKKTNYKCDLCPKGYAILMRLQRHKNDHRSGKVLFKAEKRKVWKRGEYECEICQKVMAFHYELKRLEHEEANLICDFCERKFYEKRDLLVHTKNTLVKNPTSALCASNHMQTEELYNRI